MTDPFDDLFDRWDGPAVDGTHAHSTYQALVPGFRRARTRRRLQLTGAAAVVVALAAGTPVVLSGLDDSSGTATEIDVADGTADDTSPVEADEPDATTPDDAPDPATADPTEATDTDDVVDPADDITSTTMAEPPDDDPSDAGTEPDDDRSDDVDATPSTTAPSTTVDPGPDDSDEPSEDGKPTAGPTVIRSPAGTVTASIAAGTVVIDDIDPAPGFVAETEISGDEAEVEFTAQTAGVDDVKIRIDIVDGGLVWSVENDHDSEDEEPSE